MRQATTKSILTVNSGSSSLKLALYEMGTKETLLFASSANRIGGAEGRLSVLDNNSDETLDRPQRFRTQREAFDASLELLEGRGLGQRVEAVSHRIVHGGHRYHTPHRITPQLISAIRKLIPIDPDHLPQAMQDIAFLKRKFPGRPQIACFDTAFHRSMPRVAQLCPLPIRYYDQGILRYGFHGISYEYILWELRRAGGGLADARMVIAHLGHGASMAAIQGGRSLDTSMGFTPTSGLMMGTRSGDMDPGVLLSLMARKGADAGNLNRLVNKQAGLLGVSGSSADMQELLAEERCNRNAADAIALFCYRAKKYLAAYAAVLGGLDLVVFTAGIGEHAPAIRARICAGLEMLGIEIDPARNAKNAPIISSDSSRVTVRVMKTNENLMLARHAAALLNHSREP